MHSNASPYRNICSTRGALRLALRSSNCWGASKPPRAFAFRCYPHLRRGLAPRPTTHLCYLMGARGFNPPCRGRWYGGDRPRINSLMCWFRQWRHLTVPTGGGWAFPSPPTGHNAHPWLHTPLGVGTFRFWSETAIPGKRKRTRRPTVALEFAALLRTEMVPIYPMVPWSRGGCMQTHPFAQTRMKGTSEYLGEEVTCRCAHLDQNFGPSGLCEGTSRLE